MTEGPKRRLRQLHRADRASKAQQRLTNHAVTTVQATVTTTTNTDSLNNVILQESKHVSCFARSGIFGKRNAFLGLCGARYVVRGEHTTNASVSPHLPVVEEEKDRFQNLKDSENKVRRQNGHGSKRSRTTDIILYIGKALPWKL